MTTPLTAPDSTPPPAESLADPAAPPSRPKVRWPGVVGLLIVAAAACLTAALAARWRGRAAEPADSPWQQALQALEQRDFVRARTHLDECLQVWPLNAELNFLMARTCRRAGDAVAWRSYLRRAEVLQWPRDELNFERQLMQAQSGDVWGVQKALLVRLDRFDPDEALVLEALVRGDLESQRIREVLDLTALWSERYPDDWQPHYYRGLGLYARRRASDAAAEYRKALEINPDNAEVRLTLAGALSVDGRYQEALEQFQEYLRRRPDSTAALLGLANCQLSLAQRPAARATLQELFARQKDNPAACLVQARLELEEDAPAEALTWLKRAEALAPYETDITQTEIGTLRQLGRHEEADRYEQKLKDLYQRFERLEDLKKQLLRDPENTSLRYQAGTVCLELHREDEAARWFQSVLRLDPRHAPTHRALADYFQKHGEPQRAEYHRRRAEGGGESRATTP